MRTRRALAQADHRLYCTYIPNSQADNAARLTYPTPGDEPPFHPRRLINAALAASALSLVLFSSGATAQVVANPGDTINVDGQAVDTAAPNTPALHAAGGTITGTGTTVSTSGVTSPGALADSGGQITLTNSSITTTNFGNSFGLHATGTGSSIIVGNTTITTTGSHGVQVDADASVTVTGGSITTSGPGADGVVVQGIFTGTNTTITANTDATAALLIAASNTVGQPGGAVTLNGTSVINNGANGIGIEAFEITSLNMTGGGITTTQTGTRGLSAGTGSVIQLSSVAVETSGTTAHGLVTRGTLTVDASTVTTHGANAWGVYSEPGGVVTVNGGQITTNGSTSVGLAAIGGALTSSADVTTNGPASFGAYAAIGSAVNLTGGSITTHGAGSHGLFIETTGGTITSVADITTTGNLAIGAYAWAGTMTLNGGTITTSGESAHGMEARDSGVANATGVTINVFGPTAAGVVATDGGTLTLTGSTVTSAQGLALGSQATTGLTNTVSISGSQLTSTSNTAMAFGGGIHDVTIANSQVIGGNGQLLQVYQRVIGPNTYPTQLVLNSTGSTLTGDMEVLDPGINTADVTLSASTTWTGASLGLTNLTVTGSTWNVTGDSTLTGTLTNGGTIAFQSSGPFKTITTPSYVGTGGTMNFNTALGGDNSPTDQLIIDGGSATGSTTVNVANKGGTGAMTSGTGIPIVVATGGATTTGGAFTLGGPVTAGLYQYQLFRGPESGGTPDAQNSWFLRSHLEGGNGPIPIYRPEGAMFASMPSLGRELTRNTIGTFHDYNGDQGLVRGNGAPGRAWGRVFGEAIEQGHGGLLSPNFKGNAYGFQTGVDLFESETPSGFKDRFGVFFGYAKAEGEVRGFALGIQNNYVGDSSLEGLSGGGYWTRVGPREEYLEARVVGTHYSGDGRSFANNTNIDVKGTSFAASLEGGYPIRFGSYTIEPQAQLIYQYLDMTGSDPMSSIGYDTPDALYARVGLRLSSDGLLGMSNVRPYLKANLWQDAVGTDKAIFSATDIVGTSFRSTALEVGGGVVAQLTQYASVWGMMDYTTDVSGNQDREIIRGNVGVRIVW